VPDPVHAYGNFGVYDVKLLARSIYGCETILDSLNAATVQQKPTADFTFDALPTLTLDESRFQFNNVSSSNAKKYNWDFGNSTSSTEFSPIAIYKDTGRFKATLIVFTDEGCSDTMSKNTGVVLPDFFFFMPNAFTPNGDIHNNTYRGFGSIFVYSFKMEIFNRWGEKMFETHDINEGWDGTYQGAPCMDGAYLCKVQIVPLKGTFRAYEQMFQLMR